MITVLTIVMMFVCMVVLLEGIPTEPCLRRIGRLLRVTPAMTTGGNRISMVWRHIAVAAVVICLCTADRARANGTNPTVVGGQASFSTQGSLLNITNSPGTIINWQGFSIGAGETTRFIQQSAASSVLNRVLGSDPSVILGTLSSNGRVFLINPSGVLFGQGARIDVGGLVASTLDMSNQDFHAGRLNFVANPLAGRVENQGSITTASGGSVYLVGTNVTNSGIINSPGGDVILAAGQTVKILDTGTPGVRVELTANDNLAVNLGEILAQSGEVGIYGAALRNSGIINADQAMRDESGRIVLRAKQDVVLESGSRLSASGEQAGTITVQSETGTTLVSGSIEAKGAGEATGKGGTIQLLGTRVGLTSASVDASGTTGGGTVLVGGDYQGENPSVQNASATYVSQDSSIAANAVTSGNGGKAIVWADDSTRLQGSINARGGAQSGNGGFVEVSGKHYLDFSGMVDTRAPMGQAGTLLLDPDEIQIINAAGGATLAMTCLGGGDCTTPTGSGPYTDSASAYFAPAFTVGILPDHTINQQLALGNVTVQTSTGGILISNVNSTVTLGPTTGATDVAGGNAASNANTLTLNSATNISWDAPWSYRNLGQLTLLANSSNIAGTGALTLVDTSPLLMQAATDIGSAVTPMTISGNGGNVTLTAGTSATLGAITTGAGTISATSSGTGNITISGALTSTNSGASSVVLDSTSGTGNVVSSGGSISTPGRATIFTNTIAGSSGVTVLVGSGSGNFRYNGVTTGLGSGMYAVYTEQPTLTVSANSPTAITYGDATPALTTAVSGLQNGDSAAQALSTTTTVAVGGPTSNSGNYTAGAHTLTPSAASQLGYALSYVNGTLAVNQLALAGSIAAGSSVYGAALAPGAASFSNVVSGDIVTPAAVVVTPDVVSSSGHLTAGSHTGIESVSSALSGADAANYTFAGAVGNYTVSQLALAGTIAAGSSVYGAAVAPGAASFSNVVGSDVVTPDAVLVTPDVVSTSGHLTAGLHSGIESVSGTLGGADAANYTFAGTVGNYSVSQLALAVDATGVNKVYDGLTTATATLADNRVAGDLLATAYGTASYLDKNAGNGKTLNVGGITLTGTDAGNYTVNGTATTTANITPLAITGSITANNKVYDGTAAATIATRTLSGAVAGDTVSYNGGTSLFSDKNAANTKTVTGSGLILSGTDAGNYTVNGTATTTANITPLAITGSITANNKVYDGTAAATIATRTLSGAVAGDTVSYNGGTSLFSDKNAANTKTVTGSGLVLAGTDAGNYTVNDTAIITANITPLAITGSITASNKVYDGTTAATIASRTLSGAVTGDTVSYSGGSALFIDKNAAGGKTVTGSGLVLAGTDAGNYTVNSSATTTANIIPALLGIAANSTTKTYGSTVNFTGTEFSSNGLKNGETVGSVSLASAGAAPTAGVAGGPYNIIPSAATGGTFSAGNYSISYTDGTLGVIPAPLGIAANSATRLYGDANPVFSATYTGFQNGETSATLTGALAFATPAVAASNVGNYTITPSGQTSTNYSIAYVNGKLNVIPTPLGIAANSTTKTYGSTVIFTGSEFSSSGLKNGETVGGVSLSSAGAAATASVAGGPYDITASSASGGTFSAGNYSISYTDGTLGVTPAPLGIAANSTTRLYGDANFAFSATYTGFQNGENSAALTGTLSLTTPAVATSNIGNYAIIPSGQSSSNYTVAYVNGRLNVTPAPLGIAANSATKTYGDAVSFTGSEFSSSGLKNGETVGSVTLASLGAAADADVLGSPYDITVSAVSGGTFNAGNYSISYVDGALGVLPAGLLGIAANSAVKTYNGLAFSGGNGVNYTGFRIGDTPASLEGTLAYSGSSQGAVNVGSYTIIPFGQSSPNYTIAYVNGKLSVTPAPLGIAANSATRPYGDANPAFSATYSGFQNGETSSVLTGALTLSTPVVATSNVGNYAIIPSGQSSPNYTVAYVNGKLNVTPAPLGIAANSATKTYGSTVSFAGTEFSSSGLKNGETVGNVNLSSAGAVATASVAGGPYDVAASAASGGTFNADNYAISYADGVLGVTPAPLGIAANSATRLYGDANPTLSATYTGFQNGETPAALTGALTMTTPAAATSTAGTYAIIPSGQSSPNYTVAYVNGKLNVTPAPLGIAANSSTKIYGSTVSFTGSEFSSSGLKNGETVGSVNLVSLGATATAGVAGGPYDITASAASGGTFSAGNYSISYADGTLGVIPAPLGIAANSATRLYGDANPAFSATYTGFQNGENATTLNGAPAFSTPAVPASNAGTYAIIPSGQSSSNYTISYVNGSMRVTPVSLMISADNISKVYGTSDPTLTFGTAGLVNNPALGVVDAANSVLSGTLTRTPGETVLGGPYAITQGTLATNGNYTLSSFTGSTFDITPALLTVASNTQTKVYGTSDPALTYSTTGLVVNQGLGIADTANSVLAGTLTRTPGESVAGGPYNITQGTLAANSNYTVGSFTGSNLTITPSALHVTANPQSKLFGQSDPALTYSVTGLVNNPALGITDSAASVLSGMLSRDPGESALGGPYRINQGSFAANSNYTLGFTGSNLIITGAAAEPVLGFNAGQVIFAGVINNEFYYRPGNFWHISLNPNSADPGFDVMRGTNDLNSRVSKQMDRCDSVFGGGMCESWSFPQQFEKVKGEK